MQNRPVTLVQGSHLVLDERVTAKGRDRFHHGNVNPLRLPGTIAVVDGSHDARSQHVTGNGVRVEAGGVHAGIPCVAVQG